MVGTPDLNNDGYADVLLQHDLDGKLYIWYMKGATAVGGSYLDPDAPGNPQWEVVGAE